MKVHNPDICSQWIHSVYNNQNLGGYKRTRVLCISQGKNSVFTKLKWHPFGGGRTPLTSVFTDENACFVTWTPTLGLHLLQPRVVVCRTSQYENKRPPTGLSRPGGGARHPPLGGSAILKIKQQEQNQSGQKPGFLSIKLTPHNSRGGPLDPSALGMVGT